MNGQLNRNCMLWLLAAVLLVLPACSAPRAQAGPQAAAQPSLAWSGPVEDDSGPHCASLQIGVSDQALLGGCDGKNEATPLLAHQAADWTQIAARFASFQYEANGEKLDFQGSGQVAGAAWQRALAAWSRFTYLEARAGRTGASLRTAASWWLGAVPGQAGMCRHLVVLVHGYAYAGVAPCGGGNEQSIKGGWLETSEWQAFDAWLYSRAMSEHDGSYFAGLGTAPMSADEIAALDTWAQGVYARLEK